MRPCKVEASRDAVTSFPHASKLMEFAASRFPDKCVTRTLNLVRARQSSAAVAPGAGHPPPPTPGSQTWYPIDALAQNGDAHHLNESRGDFRLFCGFLTASGTSLGPEACIAVVSLSHHLKVLAVHIERYSAPELDGVWVLLAEPIAIFPRNCHSATTSFYRPVG